ncbi:hypothetical protein [Anoxybacillus pushchinoensis]|nr:hypothetical protein [Anoxybacillus pushchinoensis]
MHLIKKVIIYERGIFHWLPIQSTTNEGYLPSLYFNNTRIFIN